MNGRGFQTSPAAAFVLACVREASATTLSEVAETAASVRNWSEVVQLAGRNRVTAFVLRAVRGEAIAIPNAAMLSLVDAVAESVARQMVVDTDLERAARALVSASILVMALKGPGLARTFFPERALRPYDDIDLSVQGADVDRVAAVLEEAEFSEIARTRTSAVKSRDFVANASLTLLELHRDSLQTGLPPRCENDRWRRASAIPGMAGLVMLAPEDQLVHLSYHAHKHGFNRLIWLKDIDMVVRGASACLDWDLVESVSRREALQSSVWLAFDYARALLGTPVPPSLLRSLEPTPTTRAMFRLAWPPANVHALRGHMRRRAVQLDTSESWRGKIASVVFMGRRPERVRLLAQHIRLGSGA
jgi:hypothetical protein